MDSILGTIKKMLGLDANDDVFDTDVIININSAFMSLHMLAIGPALGFSITDLTATWSDFLGEAIDLEGVKTYIYLKTKLVFDPPTSSFVLDAMTRQILELEWRLNVQVEPGIDPVVPVEEEL